MTNVDRNDSHGVDISLSFLLILSVLKYENACKLFVPIIERRFHVDLAGLSLTIITYYIVIHKECIVQNDSSAQQNNLTPCVYKHILFILTSMEIEISY